MTYHLLRCGSEDNWLTQRRQVVTSTEVSALFGGNPYLSHARLWAQKFTGIEHPRRMNEAMRKGLEEENTIAQAVANLRNWEAKAFPRYIFARMRDRRLGASFDWVVRDNRGLCPFEIKRIHWGAIGKQWKESGGRVTQVSDYVFYQLQTQMLVCGFDRIKLGVKVHGKDTGPQDGWYLWGEFEPHIPTQRLILAHVDAFWKSVEKAHPAEGATRTRVWGRFMDELERLGNVTDCAKDRKAA